jgi:hypothetical protein
MKTAATTLASTRDDGTRHPGTDRPSGDRTQKDHFSGSGRVDSDRATRIEALLRAHAALVHEID